MRKKVLAVGLALVMCLSVSMTAFAASSSTSSNSGNSSSSSSSSSESSSKDDEPSTPASTNKTEAPKPVEQVVNQTAAVAKDILGNTIASAGIICLSFTCTRRTYRFMANIIPVQRIS